MPFDQPLAQKIEILSDLNAARQVEEQIIREVESFGYDQQAAFALRLALEEAIVNAHKHGNRRAPDKHIVVSYDIDSKRAIVRVRDEGEGFCPNSLPDPTSPDRIPLPSGRGVMLMRAYLDKVTYNDAGNEVELIKENS